MYYFKSTPGRLVALGAPPLDKLATFITLPELSFITKGWINISQFMDYIIVSIDVGLFVNASR